MTEEQLAAERAMATFVKTLRDDLAKVFDTGLLPVAYLIAFRDPSMEKYEIMRYIARWTKDCPEGLDEVLDEVLEKWLGQNCVEFIPVSDMPNYKQ
jgi:hypothetical protein